MGITGPQAVGLSTCTAFTITRTIYGTPYVVPDKGGDSIQISNSGTVGKVYSDGACSVLASSVVMAYGSSAVSFWYKATKYGTTVLTTSYAGDYSGTQQVIAGVGAGGSVSPGSVNVLLDFSAATPMAAGLSGANHEALNSSAPLTNTEFQTAVTQLHLGWVRFPGGDASDAYDWTTGEVNTSWISNLNTLINGNPFQAELISTLDVAAEQVQNEGGVFLKDFATFATAAGVHSVIPINGFPITSPSPSPSSAVSTIQPGNYAATAAGYGLQVDDWEWSNEAFYYAYTDGAWSNAQSYASWEKPYNTNLLKSAPSANTSVFFAGQYMGVTNTWDADLATVTPFWNRVSVHVYTDQPYINDFSPGQLQNKQYFQNYILSTGTNSYYTNYFQPLIGYTPIDVTEVNSVSTNYSDPFLNSWYNGIFLGEYIARLSTHPSIEKVGVHVLYLPAAYYWSLLGAQNDHPSQGQNYNFYLTAPGVALSIVNQAVNASSGWYPTAVTCADTVQTLKASNGVMVPDQPIPSVFAQAYLGTGGKYYVLLTNKGPGNEVVNLAFASGATPVKTVKVISASNSVPTVSNSYGNLAVQASAPASYSPNSIPLGPYSVALVSW